ncbi:tubulin-like doman-containing protein [Halosimplex halophilum]|uniref:tubulin-like doman-containing protein n=1 Tax=Halosimplex halophilum TaxID=2559572 RepID=UPI00107F63C4|nr:tubulin-like doman-containing protein [Halosimplex halophilum]
MAAQEADSRVTVPDTIIGIGNAGKQVVYTLLEQDWVLEDALKPREADSNPSIDPVVIDTVTGAEQDDDVERISSINDEIEKKLGEYGNNATTELEYINPIEETDQRYTSAHGLTFPGTVADIATEANLKAWWFDQNPELLDENENYSEGVIRRRALSKALYHASQAGTGTDPLSRVVNKAGNSNKVYIVVGLGGGTGSGMFLDLAKRINETHGATDVELFGVLPGPREENDTRANAHAALSEIEYVSLTQSDPFQNVVLVPYGPSSDDDLFEEAVAYAMIAHRNLESNHRNKLNNNNDNRGPASYAPFTVCSPRILRYNAKGVTEAKEAVEEFRKEKQAALETELDLYDAAIEAIVENFDTAGEQLEAGLAQDGHATHDLYNLDGEEARRARDRLDEFEQLLGDQAFDDLDYQAHEDLLSDLRDAIDNAENGLTDDMSAREQREEVVDTAASSVDLLDPVEELYAGEEKDRELARVLRDELRAIKRRTEILKALHVIESEPIREGFRIALDADQGFAAAGDLNSEWQSVVEDIDRLEEEMADLEDLREALDGERDEAIEGWRASVEDDLSYLIDVDTRRQRLEDRLSDLNDSIIDATNTIDSAHNPKQVPDDPLDFSGFDAINQDFEALGLENRTVDEDTITASLQGLAEMKRVWLMADEEGGFLDALGDIFGPDAEEELEDRFYAARQNVDQNLFRAPSEFDSLSFDCEFLDEDNIKNRASALTKERRQRVDDVVNELDRAVKRPNFDLEGLVAADSSVVESVEVPGVGRSEDFYADQLRKELSDDLSEAHPASILDELCRDGGRPDVSSSGIVFQAFDTSFVAPVETEIERRTERLETLESEEQQYQRVRGLIRNEGSDFTENGTGPDDIEMSFDGADEESYAYHQILDPEEKGRLLTSDDIVEANLYERENKKIKTNLVEQAEEVGNLGGSLPLNIGQIENKGETGEASPDDDGVYMNHRVYPVYLSRALDRDESGDPYFEDVHESLVKNGVYVEGNREGYHPSKVGNANPWDFAMVPFVGGVFLDNLGLVSQPGNGYLNTYETERSDKRDNIRIRHTHALDGLDDYHDWSASGRGGYVVRDEVVNMGTPEHDMFVTEDEATVIDELIARHRFTEFDSTVDLE